MEKINRVVLHPKISSATWERQWGGRGAPDPAQCYARYVKRTGDHALWADVRTLPVSEGNMADWLYPLNSKPYFIHINPNSDAGVSAWRRLTPWMYVIALLKKQSTFYTDVTEADIASNRAVRCQIRHADSTGEHQHDHVVSLPAWFSKWFTKISCTPVLDADSGKWFSLIPDVSLPPEAWRDKCSRLSAADLCLELCEYWDACIQKGELVWHELHADYAISPTFCESWSSYSDEVLEMVSAHELVCSGCGTTKLLFEGGSLRQGQYVAHYGVQEGDPNPLCGSTILRGPFELDVPSGQFCFSDTVGSESTFDSALSSMMASTPGGCIGSLGVEGRRMYSYIHQKMNVACGTVGSFGADVYQMGDILVFIEAIDPLPSKLRYVGSIPTDSGSFVAMDKATWQSYWRKDQISAGEATSAGVAGVTEGEYLYEYLSPYTSAEAWDRLPAALKAIIPKDLDVTWHGVIYPKFTR